MLKLFSSLLFLFLSFSLSGTLFAHKNFWDIKATAIPDEDSISFSFFLSLNQINEFFKQELNLKEYTPEIKERLTEKLVSLAPYILSLKDDTNELVPFVKKVEIYIDESLENEKTLSLSSVDIDIELIYFTNNTKINGTWYLYADSLIKQNASDLNKLPKGALDVNIYFLDEHQSKFVVNSKNMDFKWQRKKSSKIEPLLSIEKNTTVEEKASYLPILLIILAIVFWIFSPSRFASFTSIVFIVISILSFTTPISSASKVVKTETLPDEKTITSFMDKAIKKIYVSTTAKNKSLKWSSLEGLLTDKLKEKIYIANFSMDEGQIKHFVEMVKINSLKVLSDSKVECSWEADTLFQHTSHIHEKTISFKGIFHFELKANQWLISDVNIRRNL